MIVRDQNLRQSWLTEYSYYMYNVRILLKTIKCIVKQKNVIVSDLELMETSPTEQGYFMHNYPLKVCFGIRNGFINGIGHKILYKSHVLDKKLIIIDALPTSKRIINGWLIFCQINGLIKQSHIRDTKHSPKIA